MAAFQISCLQKLWVQQNLLFMHSNKECVIQDYSGVAAGPHTVNLRRWSSSSGEDHARIRNVSFKGTTVARSSIPANSVWSCVEENCRTAIRDSSTDNIQFTRQLSVRPIQWMQIVQGPLNFIVIAIRTSSSICDVSSWGDIPENLTLPVAL